MTFPSHMRALQLRTIGRLEEVLLPVPSPAPDEVLIRTVATTICTSDLNDMRENPFAMPLPRVLGHEGAGVVAALGDRVSDFLVGDRVTAHPVISCLQCASCRRGLAHLCERMGHLALDRDGTFAEYFCIPARRVRAVPPAMELAVAALMEPVAVCLEALRPRASGGRRNAVDRRRWSVRPHHGRLASRFQPGKVIIVGRHDFRLAQATGALSINERRTTDVAEAVRTAAGGKASMRRSWRWAVPRRSISACNRCARAGGWRSSPPSPTPCPSISSACM